ncbi:ACT domain-containing protein [Roseibium sp. AS2]|uniref:glycine cleavage system protein R n=1 Tax=Roseibium sp. AS2 TaxID=3135781 RepID=UPI00317B6355
MQTHLVFTVIATDRPGLVGRMADIIAAAGGNWIESSMARLGGEFAGIVRIAIEGMHADALVGELRALSADGIDITLRSDQAGAEQSGGSSARLDMVSQDHPGILRDITRVLSAQGVSIEHLETEVVSGSMQGEALFKASADLRLPAGLQPAALSEALQETAGDLMADVTLLD